MNRFTQRSYLRDLRDSIILKDIVQHYKVRSISELKALMGIFRESLACRLSHRSLERAMSDQISIATVGKFLGYGQGAYLTFQLQKFSFKTRERINSEKKAYLVDNGFYPSIKVGGQEDFGRLLENFIFITLLRQGLRPNLDFFYYQTKAGREVDFLTLKNGRPDSLIQVCWSLSDSSTLERGLSALASAAIDLSIASTTIVTWQDMAVHSRNGITIEVVPVAEFLARDILG